MAPQGCCALTTFCPHIYKHNCRRRRTLGSLFPPKGMSGSPECTSCVSQPLCSLHPFPPVTKSQLYDNNRAAEECRRAKQLLGTFSEIRPHRTVTYLIGDLSAPATDIRCTRRVGADGMWGMWYVVSNTQQTNKLVMQGCC